jgi:hypothetical protein
MMTMMMFDFWKSSALRINALSKVF